MGGPSRESYAAAARAKQAWLDALRTRDGLVALAEWRAALEALTFVTNTWGPAPWFLAARLRAAPGVGLEIVASSAWDCGCNTSLPKSVNHWPVIVEVVNPEARPAPGR